MLTRESKQVPSGLDLKFKVKDMKDMSQSKLAESVTLSIFVEHTREISFVLVRAIMSAPVLAYTWS